MSILETTAVWTGLTGLPGYTNFHFTNAGIITTAVDNAVSGTRSFFVDASTTLPNGLTVTVSDEVKELDPATGALIALHTATTAGAPMVMAAGAPGPAPAGACIAWTTSGVNRGRRVRGRTFMVPLAISAYQSDGTLSAAYLSALSTAATNFRTSAAYESLIWSRPRAGAGGAAFPIVSSSVRDQVAVLRSRRD